VWHSTQGETQLDLTGAIRVATNIRTLPIASLIAEAVGRTAAEESVSSLFD
jgi:ribose-phosphate pyrophosphokinase